MCSPWGTRQGEDTPPKTSRIEFGVEVRLKALCFRHKQLLILPGGPGSRLARARVRGVVDAVRLGGNDQKRTEGLAPVLAPVHGSLRLRRRDVGEPARDARRRRRCRDGRARPSLSGGGSEARARRCRYVRRVLAGTRGRARVRGLLRTRFATSTATSSAFDALNTFGAIPRGARRAMDSEVGGRRDPTPKTARERARSPRRRARDGDAGARALAAI